MCQPPAKKKKTRRDRRKNYPRQDNEREAEAGAWRIAPLSTYSMGTRHSMTCSKKTHTQRHGTLVVHTKASSSSQFSSHYQGDVHTGLGKEARVPDSDVVLVPQKHPCLTTVYAAHVPSGFCVSTTGRETTSSYSKRKNHTASPWVRGHTHPGCCQHVPKSHVHPCCRLHGQKKKFAPSAVSPSH